MRSIHLSQFKYFKMKLTKEVIEKIQDFEYTKWLDPAGVPCYVHDV